MLKRPTLMVQNGKTTIRKPALYEGNQKDDLNRHPKSEQYEATFKGPKKDPTHHAACGGFQMFAILPTVVRWNTHLPAKPDLPLSRLRTFGGVKKQLVYLQGEVQA